jgi:hypothetical protein
MSGQRNQPKHQQDEEWRVKITDTANERSSNDAMPCHAQAAAQAQAQAHAKLHDCRGGRSKGVCVSWKRRALAGVLRASSC